MKNGTLHDLMNQRFEPVVMAAGTADDRFDLRLVGLGKADLSARNIDDRGIVAGPGLATKRLRILGLGLGDLAFRQG